MALLRHLPAHEYRRQRWQNGLGWTREIARRPDQPDFAWRASIAEIDHDCIYSPFPGQQRLQFLLEGAGLSLRLADDHRMELAAPHGHAAFDGGLVLQATLSDGPVRVFNLIFRPEAVSVDMLHRPLVGPMVFFAAPQTDWLIYLISGEADVHTPQRVHLDSGDSLLLSAESLNTGTSSAERVILDGAGSLLLFKLQARHPPATCSDPPAESA